jgi:hypothetical protein
VSSIAKRQDGRWRARYRDTTGKEHARHFARKVDAQRWLDEVTASVVTGTYVDPRAGRVTVREYAEAWRAMQSHRPTTRVHVETMLRRHVYPSIGDRALSSVVPSQVQELVRGLSTQEVALDSGQVVRAALAPAAVAVVHSIGLTITELIGEDEIERPRLAREINMEKITSAAVDLALLIFHQDPDRLQEAETQRLFQVLAEADSE